MQQTHIDFPSKHFTVEQLADGVYAAIAIPGGGAVSNAGIIDLGGRTLVFDTLMTPQAAADLRLASQRLTGRDPALVINSHYHNDHIWGNQAFGLDTLFVTTTKTLELMRTAGRDEIEWAEDVSAGSLADAQKQYENAKDEHARQDSLLWIGYFGGLVQALPSLSVCFPDVTIEGNFSVHGTTRSAQILAFENSHTASDVVLLLPDSGIVFMADLLFVGCHPYLDEADVAQLRQSLNSILGMGASVYVPGHGPVGTAKDVASNLDYISMCTQVAQRLVSAGDISEERLARETAPEPFARWGLSRFFTVNLESLCARLATSAATSGQKAS